MSESKLPSFEVLESLNVQIHQLGKLHASKVKEYVKSKSPQVRAELEKIQADFIALHQRMKEELERVQREAGISEEMLAALERAELPKAEERFWRREVERVAPTASLDVGLKEALAALRSLVPPEWLTEEAKKTYRLGPANIQQPIHIVSGMRLPELGKTSPQRFARMLLITQDYLDGRDDFDFLDGSLFIPEVLMLGQNLELARQLGLEAQRKLNELWQMPDEMVASTVHELLVGVATIQRGWSVEMLPENRSTKVPDMRIVDFPVPAVLECKRRVGLIEFELQEARHVEHLYQSIRSRLNDLGAHVSIEAEFSIPVADVAAGEFASIVIELVENPKDEWHITHWGRVRVLRLPYTVDLPRCRFFSPVFMGKVFNWFSPASDEHEEWDGILCEVEQPHRAIVTRARNPNCLKWRSTSFKALLKKARGIASLIADAFAQIPDGEMGFIYIAYPEGARPRIADDRTVDLLERVKKRSFYHRPTIQVPVVVVCRLYARPMSTGLPDLIESSIPLVTSGDEHLLGVLPVTVFTKPPSIEGPTE